MGRLGVQVVGGHGVHGQDGVQHLAQHRVLGVFDPMARVRETCEGAGQGRRGGAGRAEGMAQPGRGTP